MLQHKPIEKNLEVLFHIGSMELIMTRPILAGYGSTAANED